jgi:hypothetical protein
VPALTTPEAGSPWEAPAPVLFNTWKHHTAFLRNRIADCAARGEAALAELAGELVVIGTTQMDLYVGANSPAEIGQLILAQLNHDGLLGPAAYRAWVEGGGGYRVVTLPDSCNWVLRAGDENGRYVHVHPGRWAPQTRRVRANVLKTAVLALAAARGGDPLELALVNRVRRDFLALALIARLRGEQGLGEVIDLLRVS